MERINMNKTGDFSSAILLQKKKDSLLFRWQEDRDCLIKAVSPSRRDLVQALRDEYAVMSGIRNKCVPVYYDFLDQEDHFRWGNIDSWPAIMMEYIEGQALSRLLPHMDPESFLSVLLPVGHTLLDLLGAGVLYTDLNPGNVLIRLGQPPCLIDYTGAYYYRRNPRPDYRIRFSYRLSSDLPGPRLLIQELALMLESYLIDYEEKKEGRPVPSSVYSLLESGLNPSAGLIPEDYLSMLSSVLSKIRS